MLQNSVHPEVLSTSCQQTGDHIYDKHAFTKVPKRCHHASILAPEIRLANESSKEHIQKEVEPIWLGMSWRTPNAGWFNMVQP